MAMFRQSLGWQSSHKMSNLNEEDGETQPGGYTNAEDQNRQ